jgi:lipoate-protein ligase A
MDMKMQKDTWRLLITSPASGDWNMAVDEAILESAGRGDSLPTLRLYAWDPPCLSLGYAQPYADVDLARLKERGWDVVRRPTGGRAILHADELTYAVAGQASHPILAGNVLESYNRLARVISQALKSLGLPVEMKEREVGDGTSTNPVCFEVPSTYEITVDGRKLVGSAQARRKDGVLQHGSLPLSGDLTRIIQVLAFPEEDDRMDAAYRLLERATTAGAVRGLPVSWDGAAQAFVSAFTDVLGLDLREGILTEFERSRVAELVEIKYSHPSWLERG